MRMTQLIPLVAAVSTLAWSIPPTAVFDGKVLSTEKVNQAGNHSSTNSSIWKAEVKVLKVYPNWAETNFTGNVTIYYARNLSTNKETIDGRFIGCLPQLQLSTNLIYEFWCLRVDVGDETNVLCPLERGATYIEGGNKL
jgi:hypothetical protein